MCHWFFFASDSDLQGNDLSGFTSNIGTWEGDLWLIPSPTQIMITWRLMIFTYVYHDCLVWWSTWGRCLKGPQVPKGRMVNDAENVDFKESSADPKHWGVPSEWFSRWTERCGDSVSLVRMPTRNNWWFFQVISIFARPAASASVKPRVANHCHFSIQLQLWPNLKHSLGVKDGIKHWHFQEDRHFPMHLLMKTHVFTADLHPLLVFVSY